MQNEAIKDNILSPRQWLRILLMLGFVLVSWLLRFVQAAVALVQVLFALITGRTNANLRKAGAVLSLYQAHIWLFLSYCTERRPYPFTDLPQQADDLQQDINIVADPAEQVADAVRPPAAEAAAGVAAEPGVGGTSGVATPAAGSAEQPAPVEPPVSEAPPMADSPKGEGGGADTEDKGRSL